MMKQDWNGKPYYSLDYYCKETFGEKVYKIALDGGFTCPNRDGTVGHGGCIFCSGGGSGEFATPVGVDNPADSIHAQLKKGLSLFHDKKVGDKYIAYFQAYTNTYGKPERLYALYSAALSHPKVVGISIATRPDCLQDEVFAVLEQIRSEFPHKFIWIELGLQTCHEYTRKHLGIGYDGQVFEKAMADLKAHSIPVILHIILGLPGETEEMMVESTRQAVAAGTDGLKFHLLHVVEGTDLADDYRAGKFQCLSLEEYARLLKACRAMAKSGADLILCQHSHCIGCYEIYADCHIVYGQGNFHFVKEKYRNDPMWHQGLTVTYDTKDHSISFVPVVATDVGIRQATEEEGTAIMADFAQRSESLQDGTWQAGWHAFAESVGETYRAAIKPADIFGHYLDCEAHTDVWRELFPTYNQTNEK